MGVSSTVLVIDVGFDGVAVVGDLWTVGGSQPDVCYYFSLRERPRDYIELGPDALYVKDVGSGLSFSGPLKSSIHQTDNGRCSYSYGGARNAKGDLLTVVLVFPKGFLAEAFDPWPLEAKITKGERLAAAWVFTMGDRRAGVSWRQRKQAEDESGTTIVDQITGISQSKYGTTPKPIDLNASEKADQQLQASVSDEVRRLRARNLQGAGAGASGAIFLILIVAIALFVPNPSPFQYNVFRIVLALAAGAFAALIPGFLEIEIPNWLKAGGALGVFVIVFFWNPAQLVTESAKGQNSATAEVNQNAAGNPLSFILTVDLAGPDEVSTEEMSKDASALIQLGSRRELIRFSSDKGQATIPSVESRFKGTKVSVHFQSANYKASASEYTIDSDGVLTINLLQKGNGELATKRVEPREPLPIPDVPSKPINGHWDVVMLCPQGNTLNEPYANFDGGLYAHNFESGRTELAMGLEPDGSIRVTGFVLFNAAREVYPVNAVGQPAGSNYSGSGHYGASDNCTLTVTKKD
jgi:hypothetical protein